MNFFRILAEVTVDTSTGKISGGTIPQTSASTIVTNILNTAYYIAGFIAVGMIIYAGIQYITANGDTAKTKKATNTIIFSIVGLVVIIAAFTITNFVITSV